MRSIRFGLTPSRTIRPGFAEVVWSDIETGETKSLQSSNYYRRILFRRTHEKIDIGGNRGCPCQATARPPTTTYSTLFELSNSINSRKSLFSGIGINPGLEFEESFDALPGRRTKIFFDISRVGFFNASKNADNLLWSAPLG